MEIVETNLHKEFNRLAGLRRQHDTLLNEWLNNHGHDPLPKKLIEIDDAIIALNNDINMLLRLM